MKETYDVRISIRMSHRLLNAIDRYRKPRGESRAEYVRWAIINQVVMNPDEHT